MSLRLGTTDAIVVSTAAAARDVLQRYDHVLAARSEEGVRQLVACLGWHAGAGETVDVGRAVFSCVLNLVSRALFSEDVVADLSSDLAQELEMLVRDTVEEVTKPNLSDLFPVLARLDLQGRRRRSAEFVARFYDFFDPINARRIKARGSGEKIDDDFIDVLLQLHSMDQLSLQTIKSFLLDLSAAGTDTNAITVEWTMAELLRHPAVMSKVGGFAVPAGTKVIINLWTIMRDPASWAEPEAFVPERFVGASDADFRGKDRLEFMPFGAGRRACPGTPMATRVVTLLLASMLHAFEWKLPEGMQPGDVDVRDRFGTSLNMVTPLKAVPVPSHR
ncbi:unnamed protein product [Miscanthus lutarioriparius]|uniref:Cytochrome P450 n=1 Tax=Miscanthus lutarioriparius TaxID=422564 RepID=A0A811NJ49_9POAL|nr:unnamed protein product [Miscanthus lutarioriparius]